MHLCVHLRAQAGHWALLHCAAARARTQPTYNRLAPACADSRCSSPPRALALVPRARSHREWVRQQTVTQEREECTASKGRSGRTRATTRTCTNSRTVHHRCVQQTRQDQAPARSRHSRCWVRQGAHRHSIARVMLMALRTPLGLRGACRLLVALRRQRGVHRRVNLSLRAAHCPDTLRHA